MDLIPYETGAYYIFDRGYVDYTRLYRITKLEFSFIIRAKKNLKFKVISHNLIDETTDVLADQTGLSKGFILLKSTLKVSEESHFTIGIRTRRSYS